MLKDNTYSHEMNKIDPNVLEKVFSKHFSASQEEMVTMLKTLTGRV